MQNTYTHDKVTWIDLENPTREEIVNLMEQHHLHPLVAEELISPTVRPRVDVYPNSLYLILHFPTHKSGDRHAVHEIDFVITKDAIITVHYDTIDALHDFSRVFEVNSILDKHHMGDHSGFVLYHMLRTLYDKLADEMDDMTGNLNAIEIGTFGGNESEMVNEISKTNRVLLEFKRALRFHDKVTQSLESAGREFFGDRFGFYLRSITGDFSRVYSILESHRETLEELRKTNDSMLTTKNNDTIRRLTIMSFVTFPLSLIAGIFGMNTVMPFVSSTNSFYFIVGAMVLTSSIMLAVFWFKKWL
ncbi:MAG: magnesium transporter CorA family protein [Candidatus Nomurabacteria bacterium]|nr:magnesium transporter CorA family protein [Candidatus Nomurabacteria bacterium]